MTALYRPHDDRRRNLRLRRDDAVRRDARRGAGIRSPPVRRHPGRAAGRPALPAGASAGPLAHRLGAGRFGSSFARLMTLGTAATWLDADSGGSFHPQGHRLPPVPTAHPAPHILPALLDAAAEHDLDDAALLEVFLVAAEVGMRSGVASSLRVGLHPHGVHGPGAAALATALLGRPASRALGDAYLLGSCLPLAATLDVPVRGGTVRNAWTGLGSYYGAVATDLVEAGARCRPPYRRSSTARSAPTSTTTWPSATSVGGGRSSTATSSRMPVPAGSTRLSTRSGPGRRRRPARRHGWDDPAEIEGRHFCLRSLAVRDDRDDGHAGPLLAALRPGRLRHRRRARRRHLPAGRPRTSRRRRPGPAGRPRRGPAIHRRPAEGTAHAGGSPRDGRERRCRRGVEGPRESGLGALTRGGIEHKFRRNVGDLLEPSVTDDVLAALLDPGDGETDSLAVLARRVLALLAG